MSCHCRRVFSFPNPHLEEGEEHETEAEARSSDGRGGVGSRRRRPATELGSWGAEIPSAAASIPSMMVLDFRDSLASLIVSLYHFHKIYYCYKANAVVLRAID